MTTPLHVVRIVFVSNNSDIPRGSTYSLETVRSISQQAGDFTLNLVKSILQTGVYSADHPLAKAANADMYDGFKRLMRHGHELSYILLSRVDERGVMIDGLLNEPIEVAKTFRGIMGDHFVTKFHDYFIRNRIASFTIKGEIERPEFEAFLSAWVAWSTTSRDEASSAEDFSTELTNLGILRVTVVSMDEIIGSSRHLSWPTKVALSRLRKDISRLPLLQNLPSDVVADLKAQATRDVIRPIRKIDILRDIVLNADMVTDGMSTVTSLEIEDNLIAVIPIDTIFELSQRVMELLTELQNPHPKLNIIGRDIARFEEDVQRVLRKSLIKLGSSDRKEVRTFLQECHNKALIRFEELPQYVQRRIRSAETTDRFLRSPDSYIEDFGKCSDPKSYLKYLNVFVLVLPELVNRKNYQAVGLIFGILHRHANEQVPPFLGRSRFIGETLEHLESGGFLDAFIEMVAQTPKEFREDLESGVAMFGSAVMPGLVRLLAGVDEPSIRHAVCSMMAKVGEPGVPYLVDELRSHRHEWFTVRNLINILGQQKAAGAVTAINQYCAHPHGRVREECVAALCEILGPDSENEMLHFLSDKEDAVVRRTIHQLAKMHSTNQRFLDLLNDIIRPRYRNEDEPGEILQLTCLRSLRAYDRIMLPDKPDFEFTLLEIVHPSRMKSLLPGRLGVRPKSDAVVTLAIEALGARGGSKVEPVLKAISGSSSINPEHVQAAKSALARLGKRRAGSVQ